MPVDHVNGVELYWEQRGIARFLTVWPHPLGVIITGGLSGCWFPCG